MVRTGMKRKRQTTCGFIHGVMTLRCVKLECPSFFPLLAVLVTFLVESMPDKSNLRGFRPSFEGAVHHS